MTSRPISRTRRIGATAEVSTEGGVILLALDNDLCQPIVLSASGALIWRSLSQEFLGLDDIIVSVARDSGMREDAIGEDIVEFLHQMEGLGVVETVSSP